MASDLTFDYILCKYNDFKNIDIRTLIGRSNDTERWKLIFLKMRLTSKSKIDIESEYEKIRDKLGARDNDNGKLVSQCLPIGDLNSFINDLESGNFIIDNEVIESDIGLNIRNLFFKKYDEDYFTKDKEFVNWTGVVQHSNGSTESNSQKIGFNEAKMRLNFSELNDWFNIPDIDWKNLSLKILIMIPIQIKRYTIYCNNKSTLILKYLIVDTLLVKIEPSIRIYYNDGEEKKIINSKINMQNEEKYSDALVMMKITIENVKVQNIRNVQTKFYHSQLNDELFTDDTLCDFPLYDDLSLPHELDVNLEFGEIEFQKEEYLPLMTKPHTPYSNSKIMIESLEKCNQYIYWIDKYLSNANLDFLVDANLQGKINQIKLLGSFVKCDDGLKSDFKKFRKEMANKNISCEMRIIVDKNIFSDLHDRWILSQDINFNAISGDVVKRGQYAEIIVTTNNPPFQEWWDKSLDFINDFEEIIKVKTEYDKKGFLIEK